MEKLLLLGAGGHARSVVDVIEKDGRYKIAGFVDKNEIGTVIYRGYKIIGHDTDLPSLYRQGIKHAFITIGYMGCSNVRQQLFRLLKCYRYSIPTFIDSTAIMATDVQIAEGCFVGKRAVINSGASIGKMSIINTGSIVEHDCIIGDYVHVAVGAVLCGQVRVGESSFIGANSTIVQQVKIGSQVIIGANVLIQKDVESGKLVKR